jgi:photosystem II stability/assembly factor-like uncharacterized protein
MHNKKIMKSRSVLLISIIWTILSVNCYSKTIIVTTGTDSIPGSLRDAINIAQSGDVIIFDNSLTTINLGEQLYINKSLTISGNPNLTIIDTRRIITESLNTSAVHRLLEVTGTNAIVLNISNLKFSKSYEFVGDSVSYTLNGKIILIRNENAIVNIDNCHFSPGTTYSSGHPHYYYYPNGNIMFFNGQNGGGIAQYGGVLNITNSTFSNLEAGGSFYWGAGGAICQFSGSLNLTNCTFYSNSVMSNVDRKRSVGPGSAIYAQGSSNISVINCTFCEHTNSYTYYPPPGQGGPITWATYTITVFDNSNLEIKNSIFYNNHSEYDSDLAVYTGSTFNSGGYNIFNQYISTSDGAASSDLFKSNPGFVLNNGRVVLSNSTFWIPVCRLDAAGSAVDALPANGNGAPQYDQRGHFRINTPDIGACEFEGCVPSAIKAKWSPSYFGQNSWAVNMSVANDSTIWVEDINADSISITTNGGGSWTSKPLPIPNGFLRAAGGICAISESKAYYILGTSDSKGIYKTINGGDTWTKQTTGFNQSSFWPSIIHFWNENEGVSMGDANPDFEIYTTTNGGDQWNLIPQTNIPHGNNEAIYNNQTSYRLVGNSIFFMTTSARIFKSADKGLTWSVINTPFHNSIDSIITYDFKDQNNGLVSYCSNDGLKHKIYRTTNGGITWDSLTTNNFYQQIKYIPTANAYFSMSLNGGLSYSCDDGQTWISVSYFNGIKLVTASYSPSGKIFWGGLGYIYYSSTFLTVSPGNLTIAAFDNSTKTFNITSNTNWTAVSNQSWLTINSQTGSNNSIVTLTAAENQTTSTRTALVTVSGNGVTDQTITVIQDAGITTGVNEIENPEISIYPNPASTTLFIIGLAPGSKISIFDLSGKMLIIKQITSNQFDISNLSNGIYLIKIADRTGITTKRFVKI